MVFKAITASVQGGSALERHLHEIEKRLGHGAHVRVGFLASETYPNKVGGGSLHVAQVMFWQEFGAPKAGIPERPFMRDMVERRSPRWGVALGHALRKNNYNAEAALAVMGQGIQGQLRESIQGWSSPPNADSTVARKGFNKPLIETGQALRSVDYQVITGDGGEDD